MDIVELIVAGHRHLDEKRDLLSKLLKMLDNDAFFWDKAEKIDFFFRKEVQEHFAMEEKVLFPVMKKVLKGCEIETLEAIELEHGPILKNLAELKAVADSHLRFASKATREPMVKAAFELVELIAAHAKKEDERLFPLIKERFNPVDFSELETLYFSYLKV